MRKYGAILFYLLLLAAATVGAFRWADALQRSVFTYQSPLAGIQIAPGESMPPQTRRVVLVIVGGLGYDAAGVVDMPDLETLLEAGASAPMVSRPPTYSPPAWTTLLTGVWPELNNAPLMDTTLAGLRPIQIDHLFAAANDAGLRTAVAGFEGWARLLPAGAADVSFFTPNQDAAADGQVAGAALEFIADPQNALIIINFSQLDAAGRAGGVASEPYASAARQVDRHLRQITRLADLLGSVLIVTSDHGFLEDGRLGGDEPELTQLPWVMIGQNVTAGEYSPVRQIDLAPTVAALLGTRLPATAQGRPLYEMIRLDQEALVLGQLGLATQKVALGDAYLAAIGREALSQATHQDLASARQAWIDGNRAGAIQLAELVTGEAAAEMASSKATRIAGERWRRLGVAVLALLLPLLLFWGRRGPNSLVGIVGGLVAVAIYYSLYRLGGSTFSLSAVGAPGAFVSSLLRDAAIGLGAGGLTATAGLLYRDERRALAALSAGYEFGLFAVYLAALPALYGYWQHGVTLRWYLPDLRVMLLHFMALVQVATIAFLAILLPWLVALVAWRVGRWRTRAEARAQEWDPIARLRR